MKKEKHIATIIGCPFCGSEWTEKEIKERDYRCLCSNSGKRSFEILQDVLKGE